MAISYKKRLRAEKKFIFSTETIPYLFILKTKASTQNLQKFYKYHFLQNNFCVCLVKQKKIINFLKKTEYRNCWRHFQGSVTFVYYKNTQMTLDLVLSFFFQMQENLPFFNKSFELGVLLNFKDKMILSKALLYYYYTTLLAEKLIHQKDLSGILLLPICDINNCLLTFFYKNNITKKPTTPIQK